MFQIFNVRGLGLTMNSHRAPFFVTRAVHGGQVLGALGSQIIFLRHRSYDAHLQIPRGQRGSPVRRPGKTSGNRALSLLRIRVSLEGSHWKGSLAAAPHGRGAGAIHIVYYHDTL